MDHVPSGNLSANSAWLQCAVLANNLICWTATIGETDAVDQLTVAPGSSRSLADSSTGPAPSPCAARSTGRGPSGSTDDSIGYAHLTH